MDHEIPSCFYVSFCHLCKHPYGLAAPSSTVRTCLIYYYLKQNKKERRVYNPLYSVAYFLHIRKVDRFALQFWVLMMASQVREFVQAWRTARITASSGLKPFQTDMTIQLGDNIPQDIVLELLFVVRCTNTIKAVGLLKNELNLINHHDTQPA